MEDLKVTLCQSELHWQSIDANLAMFEEKLWALNPVSDIIVLPEMFNTGFTMQAHAFSEPMNGKTHRWMKKMAEQFKTIVTGSLIIKEKDNYYNRLIWVKKDGHSLFYDKRHLFRMSEEQNRFSAGRNIFIGEIKDWKIRPFICYDLRFPVWIRNKYQTEKNSFDYDVSIFVANWPASRIDVWSTLLKSRAIENSSYCIGLNRIGNDGLGTSYNGYSGVCDFKGNNIYSLGEDELFKTVTLSYEQLMEYRQKFPVQFDADNFNIVY